MVGWQRLKEGFLKLSIDGSYKKDLFQTSAGGLLRYKSGKWIEGFIANQGHYDSLMAETWAVVHDLEMAWKIGHKKINLEMDSLLLSRLIRDQSKQ